MPSDGSLMLDASSDILGVRKNPSPFRFNFDIEIEGCIDCPGLTGLGFSSCLEVVSQVKMIPVSWGHSC